MNRDLRVLAIILSLNSPLFERFFSQSKIGSLEGHFGFLAQNAENHVQNIANIVWIVIYACSRSFWARTRLDLRDFFDAPKFSFWRAILGFWPKTLKIIYKSWQILYESWSTRSRDHFERKFASIWQSKNSLPLRRVWAENYPGYAYITIHTILPMICTWFLSFLAKNPKWHIKGPKFGRPKILSNRSKFGLKWPWAYVDHDSYNISNDLYMIFIFFGQNPKWHYKGPKFGRTKILSNCDEFGLKLSAGTRRSRFIQYYQWLVHDLHRFWPKTQNGTPRAPNLGVQKFSPVAGSLGSKRPRVCVDH